MVVEIVAALTALEEELKEPLTSVARRTEALVYLKSGMENHHPVEDLKVKTNAHKTTKEITTTKTNL